MNDNSFYPPIIRVAGKSLRAALEKLARNPGLVAVAAPEISRFSTGNLWVVRRFKTGKLRLLRQPCEQRVVIRRVQDLERDAQSSSLWRGVRLNDAALPEEIELLVDSSERLVARYSQSEKSCDATFQLRSDDLQVNPITADPADIRDFPRTNVSLGPQWERWRSLRLGFVGAGRLGSLLLPTAVATGIRDVVVVDGDRVERSNFDGTCFAVGDDGNTKVAAIERDITAIQPECRVCAVDRPLETEEALEQLALCDVLIVTADHALPRLHANWLGRKTLLPVLDVGTGSRGGWSGIDIRLALPLDRCLLCLGGVPDGLPETTTGLASGRRMPGNSTRQVNGVAAHAAWQLLVAFVRGEVQNSRWMQIRLHNDGKIDSEEIEPVGRPRDCPWCRPQKR